MTITDAAIERRGATELLRLLGPGAASERARTQLAAAEAKAAGGGGGHSPFDFPAAGVRHALEDRADAAARFALVEALGRGQIPPSWPASGRERQVAVDLLRKFTRPEKPERPIWLVGQLTQFVREDEGELAKVKAGIETQAHGRGALGPDYRATVARLIALETRLPRRRAILEAFRAEFASRCARAVGGNAEVLVSGLFESLAALGRLAAPDPEIARVKAALTDVRRRLEGLTVAGELIAPGPLAQQLLDQHGTFTRQLEQLRVDHAAKVGGEVRDLADRGAGGDPSSWTTVARVIVDNPGAFPDGLGDRLIVAPIDAMIATEPIAWARTLEASVRGGTGREF
jgi:hypothetical protein